jgi:hypothetical protein
MKAGSAKGGQVSLARQGCIVGLRVAGLTERGESLYRGGDDWHDEQEEGDDAELMSDRQGRQGAVSSGGLPSR